MGATERVLVTDVHELAGLGTVRSLGSAGHHVIGVHPEGARAAALHSRYLADSFAAPDPWRDLNVYRERLLSLLDENPVDALFPVSEASQVAVRGIADRLPANVTLVLPHDHSLRFSLSKFESTAAAGRFGVAIPETVFLYDGDQVHRDELDSWSFPYLVKSDNVEVEDGSYLRGQTFHIGHHEDLEAVLDRCLSTRSRAIAQRHVPGRGVGAFLLRIGGRILLEFAHERLHEVPYTGGWSALRRSVDDPRVIAPARRLLDAIDYQGLAMVEFRQQGEEEPVFLEINGRPWGSIALSLHAGVDFPLAALDAARGRIPMQSRARRRRTSCVNLFPGEAHHLASLIRADGMGRRTKARRFARSTVEALLAAVDPRVRGDFLWWSDPGPGLFQARQALDAVLRAVLRKVPQPDRSDTRASGAKPPDLASCHRLLFVCHGNICRSPFAALRLGALLREEQHDVEVDSAGLAADPGRPVPAWFHRLFDGYGLEWRQHRSRQVVAADIERFDVVIVLEPAHRTRLVAALPAAAGKTWTFGELGLGLPNGIPDPFDMAPLAAVRHFADLDRCVRALASAMASRGVSGRQSRGQGGSNEAASRRTNS